MSAQRLSCRELVDLLTAYLDGALDAGDRERFERHLSRCDGCSEYVQQMRKTITLVGALREDDIAVPVRESLLDAFRDWKTRPRP